MTGISEFNYPAFNVAANFLRSSGFRVFNPAETFNGETNLPKEVYMKTDIQAVLNADLVLVLEGWESSSGALLEVEVAKACGIRVENFDEFMLGCLLADSLEEEK